MSVNLLSSAVDRRDVLGVAVGEWGNDKECDWWWLRGEKQKRELLWSSLFVVPPEKEFHFKMALYLCVKESQQT